MGLLPPGRAGLVDAKLAKGLRVEEEWDVYLTTEVDQWLHDLEKTDPGSYVLVNQASGAQ